MTPNAPSKLRVFLEELAEKSGVYPDRDRGARRGHRSQHRDLHRGRRAVASPAPVQSAGPAPVTERLDSGSGRERRGALLPAFHTDIGAQPVLQQFGRLHPGRTESDRTRRATTPGGRTGILEFL